MKKNKKIQFGILCAFSLMIFNGCKKDSEPGKDGNANVTATTFTSPSWTDGTYQWYTDLSVPALTPDNINTASVQVYMGTISNVWRAVPFTEVASTNYFMGFTTTIGKVQITWEYNGVGTGSSPNTYYGATCQFKVVVIPPSKMKSNPKVDLNNYEEVKKTFNLKD